MHAAHPVESVSGRSSWPGCGEKPIAQIAKDLQISESCLRRWMDQADVDAGHKRGLSTDERKALVELRRSELISVWCFRAFDY